ncbi:hypothetical protein D3C86_1376250 [compost metagenome]
MQATLPRVLGLDIVATQRHAERGKQALATLVDEVGEAEVAARRRQAALAPLQLVVGADGHVGVDLQLAGHLADRAEDFLELRVGHRQRLDQVQRGLRRGDAVGAEEQAFAVQLGEAAGLGVEVHVRRSEAAIDEGVQQLGLAPVQLLGVVGELVEVDGTGVHQCAPQRPGIVVGLVVDVVVPGCTAEAQAVVALVAQVELGEQVEAVGDQPFVEVEIAVVGVGLRADGVVGDVGVGILHAPGGAVLDGVVPRHAHIGIAGVDLEGERRSSGRQARNRAGYGEKQLLQVELRQTGAIAHVFILEIVFVFVSFVRFLRAPCVPRRSPRCLRRQFKNYGPRGLPSNTKIRPP